MSESFKTRLMRWRWNLFPAFRATGARVTFLSNDLRELHLKLPLNRRTRNYVGTMYGGSMYGAVDGILMVMFIQQLDRNYIVWDKSGTIRYRKPGRSTLFAKIRISDEDLAHVHETLGSVDRFDREFRIDLVDESGDTCAEVDKLLHFRRKQQSD